MRQNPFELEIQDSDRGSRLRTAVTSTSSSHQPAMQGLKKPSESESLIVPPHPLGIKPAGNVYDADVNMKAAMGLFALLPEETLIEVLEYLNATALQQLDLVGSLADYECLTRSVFQF